MPNQSQRIVTAVLIGAAFLAGIDLFIVNVAFDQIGRDFDGAGLTELSWILNAYAVVYAALLVPMGRLADRAGQKRGFVAGMMLFIAASLACGFAPGIWWLVGFRVVQAIGAAAMTPASLGLLLATVAPEKRASSARLWALTGAVAAALGPALGGGLVQLSWQWAFWINLPVGLLLVAGALRYVPDVRHNEGTPLPDLAGAVVLAVSVGALVLGLVQASDWGWTSARVLGAFSVSVLGMVVFARRTLRHPSPIIAPALLAVPAFRWANVATLVFNTGFGASLLGAILWLQQAWSYGALQTGLAIAIGPLAVPVTSVLAHRLTPHARPGHMVAAGSLIFGASALWQALALSPTPAYWTAFLPAWVLGGVGVGLAMPNLLAAAASTLPPAQVSTGGGVVTMARQVGLVLGVSMLVTMVDKPDHEAAFTQAWCAIAVCAALSALAALRLSSVTTATAARQLAMAERS
ncbi:MULTISPECIES: MFS transporter [unclassified Nocardioides]|uniref:MFS transporter n=1 Tax=unclassified Nocardioides TaxID=2615069 RepID=UPI000A9C1EEA|nr:MULTISPECIES: MFS transporter [unclassified Nocardioides]